MLTIPGLARQGRTDEALALLSQLSGLEPAKRAEAEQEIKRMADDANRSL